MTQGLEIPAEDSGDNRRTYGRRLQECLGSDLGVVLDLSAGGMRILTTKVPDDPVKVTIFSLDGSMSVYARVAWIKKRRIGRKREVGLQFLQVDERTRRALTKISSTHRVASDPQDDTAGRRAA